MPDSTLEIRVSRRELDRPRLIEVFACTADGAGVAAAALVLSITENGTFDDEDEAPVITREAVTGPSGHTYFQWYEYPRVGPRRDLTSVVVATWQDETVFIYMQDMYE